jgi:hypothetical protein
LSILLLLLPFLSTSLMTSSFPAIFLSMVFPLHSHIPHYVHENN